MISTSPDVLVWYWWPFDLIWVDFDEMVTTGVVTMWQPLKRRFEQSTSEEDLHFVQILQLLLSKTVFSFVFNTGTGSAVSQAVSWRSGVLLLNLEIHSGVVPQCALKRFSYRPHIWLILWGKTKIYFLEPIDLHLGSLYWRTWANEQWAPHLFSMIKMTIFLSIWRTALNSIHFH